AQGHLSGSKATESLYWARWCTRATNQETQTTNSSQSAADMAHKYLAVHATPVAYCEMDKPSSSGRHSIPEIRSHSGQQPPPQTANTYWGLETAKAQLPEMPEREAAKKTSQATLPKGRKKSSSALPR